jgi:hypothetical protein
MARRHIVFSFISPLADFADTGDKHITYYQETFQLEARTRAQYVRPRFMGKTMAKDQIMSMLLSVANLDMSKFKAVKVNQKESDEDYAVMNMLVPDGNGGVTADIIVNGNPDKISYKRIRQLILEGTTQEQASYVDAIYDALKKESEQYGYNVLSWDITLAPNTMTVIDMMTKSEMDYMTKDEAERLKSLMLKAQTDLAERKDTRKEIQFERAFKTSKGDRVHWTSTLTEEERDEVKQLLGKFIHGYIVNRYTNMYFLNQIIAGDFVFYKNARILVKRLLGASSPGRIAMLGKYGMPHTTDAVIVNDMVLNQKAEDWSTIAQSKKEKIMADVKRNPFIKPLFNKEVTELTYLELINSIDKELIRMDEGILSGEIDELDVAVNYNGLMRAKNFYTMKYNSSIESFLRKIMSRDKKYQNAEEEGNESVKEELEATINKILSYYGDVESTDGQSLMTEEGYYELMKGMDPAFDLSGTIKSMYYGQERHIPSLDKSGYVTPLYIKNSYLVLKKELTDQYPELRNIANYLTFHGMRELHFNSAVKVGNPKDSLAFEDIEYWDGTVSESSRSKVASAAVRMHNRFRRIQFNPKAKLEKEVALLSQMMYMISVNTAMPETARLAYEAQAFLIEKGMYDTVNNRILGSLSDYIRDMIKKSPEAMAMYEYLSMSDSELVEIALTNPYLRKKFTIAVIGDITKNSVNIKLRGSKLVLASGDLLSSNKGKKLSVNLETIGVIENGERVEYEQQVADVVVPEGLFDMTPEVKKAIEEKGFYFVSGDLMSARLPTTGKNSGVVFRVVGMHKMKENIVFMPTEIMAIHGSDFDVDSLFTLQREYFSGKETISFMYNGIEYNIFPNQPVGYTEETVSINGKEDVAYQYSPQYMKDFLAALSEERTRLKRENRLTKDKDQKRANNKILNQLDRVEDQALRNTIVEMIHMSLGRDEHFEQMVTPISSVFIDDIISDLSRNYGYKQEFEGTINLSLISDSSKMQKDNQVGAALTGYFANGFKAFAYVSRSGIIESNEIAYREILYKGLQGYEKTQVDANGSESKVKYVKLGDQEVRFNKSIAMGHEVYEYLDVEAKRKLIELSRAAYLDNSISNIKSAETVSNYLKTSISKLRTPVLIGDTTYGSISEFSYFGAKGKEDVIMTTWEVINAFVNEAIDNPKNTKLGKMNLTHDNAFSIVSMIMVGMPYHQSYPIVPLFARLPFMNLLSYGRLAGISSSTARMGFVENSNSLVHINGIEPIGVNIQGKKVKKEYGLLHVLVKALLELNPEIAASKYVLFDSKSNQSRFDINAYISDKEEGKASPIKMEELKEFAHFKYTKATRNLMNAFFDGKLKSKDDVLSAMKVAGLTTEANIEKFMAFQFKAIQLFLQFDEMGNSIKKFITLFSTLRENEKTVEATLEMIDNVKATTIVDLKPRYAPDISFATYRDKLETERIPAIGKSKFEFQSLFNRNPQITAALMVPQAILDTYEQSIPMMKKPFRDFVSSIYEFAKLGSERAPFSFSRSNPEAFYAAEQVMLNELERFALALSNETIQVYKNIDDIKSAIDSFKTRGEFKNNMFLTNLYIVPVGRATTGKATIHNVDLTSPAEVLALSSAASLLRDYYYDFTTKKIMLLSEVESEQEPMPLTHLLAIMSAFTVDSNGKAEDKLLRALPKSAQSYLGHIKKDALEAFELMIENSEEIDSPAWTERNKEINKIKMTYLFNFLKRHIDYVREVKHSPDYGIEVFDTENKKVWIESFYGEEKTKEVRDYAGVEQVKIAIEDKIIEKTIYFDLKLTSDKKLPYVVRFNNRLYAQIMRQEDAKESQIVYHFSLLPKSVLITNYNRLSEVTNGMIYSAEGKLTDKGEIEVTRELPMDNSVLIWDKSDLTSSTWYYVKPVRQIGTSAEKAEFKPKKKDRKSEKTYLYEVVENTTSKEDQNKSLEIYRKPIFTLEDLLILEGRKTAEEDETTLYCDI